MSAAEEVSLNAPPESKASFLGHPRGLAFLFVVEMWERFSFYGMKALLILYLVNVLRWPMGRAATLYGNYTALAYLSPLLGGYIADRFWGARRSLVCGGIIIALGHFTLALDRTPTFYCGLVLVVLGTGIFKPNVSTMVGQLYGEGDQRRDSGFTIFFMGISVGAFVAPLACGYLAERYSWTLGFSVAGMGMIAGLVLYLWGANRYLPGIGYKTAHRREGTSKKAKKNDDDRKRITAVALVVLLTIPFWACYEQFGSSLSLFADRHIDRSLSGFVIPASWFQSINPVVILIFAPMLAYAWTWLQKKNREPSALGKMGLGYFLIGAGFLFATAAGFRSATHPLVSPLWFVGTDIFRSWGELMLSPVGLSYIAKIAPRQYESSLMAAWFVAEGLGNKLAGVLAARSDFIPAGSFYSIFAITGLVMGMILLAAIPLMNFLTRSVESQHR